MTRFWSSFEAFLVLSARIGGLSAFALCWDSSRTIDERSAGACRGWCGGLRMGPIQGKGWKGRSFRLSEVQRVEGG